jgi:hypothetical protein
MRVSSGSGSAPRGPLRAVPRNLSMKSGRGGAVKPLLWS